MSESEVKHPTQKTEETYWRELLTMWFQNTKKKLGAKNPEPLYRFLSRLIIKLFYKIESQGFERIPAEGAALLIANHISYIDGVLIQAACKNRPIRFIIDKWIFNLPIVHYFMTHNRAIPIAAKKEDVTQALNDISQGLESGDLICIFPEGRLTFSGYLGRFKPGIEWIIHRDPTPIYPITIEGVWGSIFSRKYRKSIFRFIPRRIRPTVRITCGQMIPPEKATTDYLHRVILSNLSHGDRY